MTSTASQVGDEPDITFYDDIEGYPGALSYGPGDTATLHASTRADRYHVAVERWGARREPVWSADDLAGVYSPPPADADSRGCRWPVSLEIPIDEGWRSGFYLVTMAADGSPPERATAHTGFVVRGSADPGSGNEMLLILATNTWNAYNTWGGRSLYTGATQVAFGRPWSRGMLCRETTERDDRKARPVRWGEDAEVDGEIFQQYRLSRGFAPAIGSSGWYLYERRFVEWAEADGYEFDYAVSSDLDRDPSVLDGYKVVVGVGHDEYWSAPQRRVVEDHVRTGGRYVSFSGNTMFWQVRIEPVDGAGEPEADDAGEPDTDEPEADPMSRPTTMVCHKYTAHDTDPVVTAGQPERMSGMFADPLVGRPETAFLGAGSAWGLYHRFGQAVARGAGAFTVYRDDHWLLAGSGLRYGDLLGAAHGCVGYETVGCRIQFDDLQLPVPAGGDGTPPDMTIVAFSPSSNLGVGEYPKSISAKSDQGDLEFIAQRIHGDLSRRSLAKARHGNAVVAEVYPFGPRAGQVITIGTTDWAFGLPEDEAVAQVTRNALNGEARDQTSNTRPAVMP